MKRIFAACLLVLFGCATSTQMQSSSWNQASRFPASDIPDKREFPLNPAIAPCDDFYEHVCSKVKETFHLRPDRSRHYFAFHDSAERITTARMKFLDDLTQEKIKADERLTQLVDNYNACLNVTSQKQEELEGIQTTLDLMKKTKTRDQFLAVLEKNLTEPGYTTFHIDKAINLDDPDQWDLYTGFDTLSLPEPNFYTDAKAMKAFRELTENFFKTIGMDRSATRAANIVKLEIQLAKSFPDKDTRYKRYLTPSSISRDDLFKQAPTLRLQRLLSYVPEKTLIRYMFPEHLKAVNLALETTDLTTLKDYYIFHDLQSLIDQSYPAFFAEVQKFKADFLGEPPSRSELKERCTKAVVENFSQELDAAMIDTLFPNFPSGPVAEMVERIRAAYLKVLAKNTWLSPEAKAKAILKLKTADMQLVRPKTENDWDFKPLAKYSSDKPIKNSKILVQLEQKQILEDLKHPRNRNLWLSNPLLVNASYISSNNQFVLNQGILQPPSYDTKSSMYVNLGAIGVVIGHEIGHAIDIHGSEFDEKGRRRHWMTKEDQKTYNDLSQRLVEQFNQIGLNGQLTLGENGADLAGVTAAYEAAFPDGEGRVENKQAFFIQYGRQWCNVATPEYEKSAITLDEHSSGKARVNEQVKNQAGFTEAFSCKVGDKMYSDSQSRVKIW